MNFTHAAVMEKGGVNMAVDTIWETLRGTRRRVGRRYYCIYQNVTKVLRRSNAGRVQGVGDVDTTLALEKIWKGPKRKRRKVVSTFQGGLGSRPRK